jgi:hypothetical protein
MDAIANELLESCDDNRLDRAVELTYSSQYDISLQPVPYTL